MINKELLEALEKTYAEIPPKMLEENLTIIISPDWEKNNEEKITKYRGIDVQSCNLCFNENQIFILRKKDYFPLFNEFFTHFFKE